MPRIGLYWPLLVIGGSKTTAAAVVCLNSAQLLSRQLLRMSLHATRAASCRLHATRAETAQCLSKAYGEDAAAVIGGGGSRYPLIWDARALKLERSAALFVASRMSFPVVAVMCAHAVQYVCQHGGLCARRGRGHRARLVAGGVRRRGGGPSGPLALMCDTARASPASTHYILIGQPSAFLRIFDS